MLQEQYHGSRLPPMSLGMHSVGMAGKMGGVGSPLLGDGGDYAPPPQPVIPVIVSSPTNSTSPSPPSSIVTTAAQVINDGLGDDDGGTHEMAGMFHDPPMSLTGKENGGIVGLGAEEMNPFDDSPLEHVTVT